MCHSPTCAPTYCLTSQVRSYLRCHDNFIAAAPATSAAAPTPSAAAAATATTTTTVASPAARMHVTSLAPSLSALAPAPAAPVPAAPVPAVPALRQLQLSLAPTPSDQSRPQEQQAMAEAQAEAEAGAQAQAEAEAEALGRQARRRADPEELPGCPGHALVGQRLRVFWEGSRDVQQGWYQGRVSNPNPDPDPNPGPGPNPNPNPNPNQVQGARLSVGACQGPPHCLRRRRRGVGGPR